MLFGSAQPNILAEEEIRGVLKHLVVGKEFDPEAAQEDLVAIDDLAFEKHGERVFVDIQGRTRVLDAGIVVEIDFIDAWPIPEITVDIDVLSEEWFLSAMEFQPGMSFSSTFEENIVTALKRANDEEGFVLELIDFQIDEMTGAMRFHNSGLAIRRSFNLKVIKKQA